VTEAVVRRALRRLVATGKAHDLAACIAFLENVSDSVVRRRALEGLVLALQNRQVDPPKEWQRVFAALVRDPDGEVQRLARHLAVNFPDVEAIGRALALARDGAKSVPERVEAIREVELAHPPEALRPLEELLAGDRDLEIRSEACRGDPVQVPAGLRQHILDAASLHDSPLPGCAQHRQPAASLQ